MFETLLVDMDIDCFVRIIAEFLEVRGSLPLHTDLPRGSFTVNMVFHSTNSIRHHPIELINSVKIVN
jgi:hypothetical protein